MPAPTNGVSRAMPGRTGMPVGAFSMNNRNVATASAAIRSSSNGGPAFPLATNRGRSTGKADRVACLLYTSDAADEEDSVDLGGRRIIKKKKKKKKNANT